MSLPRCPRLRRLSALALSILIGTGASACRSDAEPATPEPPPEAASAGEPGDPSPAAGAGKTEVSPAIAAIVDAEDRTEDDRELDAQRRPAELLAFLDLKPGMRVADLMAGFGYTTELLARAVGPEGVVYGQNNRFVLERFAEQGWSERLARAPMGNAVRVDRELDDPLPPEATALDAVVMVLFYHDTVWMETDRAAMNRAIFAALRPGGAYVIIDHSGREGTGMGETQTLHRIEESALRAEIEAAGFVLAAEAEFLRNPADPRDWNAAPRTAAEAGRRGESDRFVLKFVKPS